jgi:ABC-type sugar transport system ATPase subunit
MIIAILFEEKGGNLMNDEVLLEAKGISIEFPGIKALDNVDFTLKKGTVHALMGENGAGKSTLVKCFMGIKYFGKGKLNIQGDDCHFNHPKQAIAHGMSLIEQELTPVMEMTVAENICLGREDLKYGIFLNYSEINKKAEKYVAMLGIDIDVTAKMKSLSIAQIQLVEIAKALSFNSSIIIMDEPTSAIGEKEVALLFNVIRQLREAGKAIVYVSHRMEEIFTITDEITVLRDGKYIGTVQTKDTPREEVINMMVGEKINENFIKNNEPSKELKMQANHISQKGVLTDISLDLHKGEILGLFGLLGSGRSEFCDAFFGVSDNVTGEFKIDGKTVNIKNPQVAMKNKVAYVTEDRKNSGLEILRSVKENISLANLDELSDGIFINSKRERELSKKMTKRFSIKTPSIDQLVLNLSGGNQQKVVLGKWIARNPEILILDEPTRGIDVKAKHEIYEFMSKFTNQGKSIIFISSEIPEILMMSDNICIFNKGSIKAKLSKNEANQNDLMYYASVTEQTKEEI